MFFYVPLAYLSIYHSVLRLRPFRWFYRFAIPPVHCVYVTWWSPVIAHGGGDGVWCTSSRSYSNQRSWKLFSIIVGPRAYPAFTMLQSIFDDVRRMNKRQVNRPSRQRSSPSRLGGGRIWWLCTNILWFSVSISSAELWHDSLVGADDMEGPDGRHRQREPYCRRIEVRSEPNLTPPTYSASY